MDNLRVLIDEVADNSTIDINDIPDIDLYMDQVIQLFDNKLSKLKRTEEEKILTKTMINNYVKGKLLMPVNKKKYSKEHILLMSLIYELKGILSINDIQKLLEPMVEDIMEESKGFDLEKSYENIDTLKAIIALDFKNEIIEYEEKINSIQFNEDYEKLLVLSSLLASKANLYKRFSEKLLDENINKICKK